MEYPNLEADGSISWLPHGTVRLASLTVRRRQADGGWLTTVYGPPAEVYRQEHRFFIRRPKRAGFAWHTTELDADALGATVDELATPTGAAVTLSIEW
jgi:hypothetical protein